MTRNHETPIQEFSTLLRKVLAAYTTQSTEAPITDYGTFHEDFKAFRNTLAPIEYFVDEDDSFLETARKVYQGTRLPPFRSNFLSYERLLDYCERWLKVSADVLADLKNKLDLGYAFQEEEKKRLKPHPKWSVMARKGIIDSRVSLAETLIGMVEHVVENNIFPLDQAPHLRVSARTLAGFFNAREALTDDYIWEERLRRWRTALASFLNMGGRVTYVFRVDEDGPRGRPHELMFRLFEGGRTFSILYHEAKKPIFDKEAPPQTLIEYAFIEHFAGIMAMATTNDLNDPSNRDAVNRGLILKPDRNLKSDGQLEILTHLANRFEQGAKTLYSHNPHQEESHPLLEAARNGLNLESECYGANLYKRGLPDKTRPEFWLSNPNSVYLQKLTEALNLTADQVKRFVELETSRWATFTDRVKRHVYRDIVPLYVFDALVDESVAKKYKLHRITFAQPSAIKIERLEHWLNLIEQYPNYQIGILQNEKTVSVARGFSGTFVCSEGQDDKVVVEILIDSHGPFELFEYVTVTSKNLSRGFKGAFEQTWGAIPIEHKSREFVKSQIISTIEKLKLLP
jgi:hypothetical protein